MYFQGLQTLEEKIDARVRDLRRLLAQRTGSLQQLGQKRKPLSVISIPRATTYLLIDLSSVD
jgi:hypothetical protein